MTTHAPSTEGELMTERDRHHDRTSDGAAAVDQPDSDASSDGDGSWTDDPITADPDEDRSVEAVIASTEQGRPTRTDHSDGGSDSPSE
jgi:hypothetical protein